MKKWFLKNGVMQYKKMSDANVDEYVTHEACPLFMKARTLLNDGGLRQQEN